MQRMSREIGSLGLVRRAAPDAHRAPSRTVPQTPLQRVTIPDRQRITPDTQSSDSPPTSRSTWTARGNVDCPKNASTAGDKNDSSINTSLAERIDQMDMRVHLVEDVIKGVERVLTSLRQDIASITRAQGGRLAERVDEVERQTKQFEQSFTDLSARIERQLKEASEQMTRAFARESAAEVKGDSPAEYFSEALRALEERLANYEQRSVAETSDCSSVLRTELVNWLDHRLETEIVPELRRGIAAADRKDIVNDTVMTAMQQLREHMESTVAEHEHITADVIHRCSHRQRAVVLREVNGFKVDDVVFLQHPISRVQDTYYMTRLSSDGDGAIRSEQFLVEDEDGPAVLFQNETPISGIHDSCQEFQSTGQTGPMNEGIN